MVVAHQVWAFFFKNGRRAPSPAFLKNGHRALTLDTFKKSQAFWLKHYGRPDGEVMLKMGWMVKKYNFSFFNGSKEVKLHSDGKLIYWAINIY